jgi:murein DD-endopeptidase MepM/ murein hydrolase activator NlpD
MPQNRVKIGLSLFGISVLLFCVGILPTQADEPIFSEVQQSIKDKKTNIDQLNQQIETYQKKIQDAQSKKITLESELDLLENRALKTQLEIDETTAQIDLLNAEIANTESKILEMKKRLERQKEIMVTVIQKIQSQDNTLNIQLFYGSEPLSMLLDTVQKLEQINSDLAQAVKDAKALKVALEQAKADQEVKRTRLHTHEEDLQTNKMRLSEELEAKEIILATTRQSEKKFQSLVEELKQEQVFVQNQIRELQTRLEQRIQPSDEIGGGLLSWPLSNTHRLSASFHDPTYPFRNLFEHSGIDIPAPKGTPVHSAAAGFVAWTRRGAQYGNYVMIIHSNGVATLYAHLSRIDVVADQFIPRGGQIGLVGSTGLSTGPHLHFEVRKEGIPTDPMLYLD